MKRKCLGLIFVTIFCFIYLQIPSGCVQKIAVTPGNEKKIEVTIASKSSSAKDDSDYEMKNKAEMYDSAAADRARVSGEVEYGARRVSVERFEVEKLAKENEFTLEEGQYRQDSESSFKDEALGSELWIIEKNPAVTGEEDKTGSPKLVCSLPGEKEVILPLEHTTVDAHIAGYIATVNVLQKYHNPYSKRIEAVYVFPLPHNAAVTDFVMIIGDRKIRGLIREKEEAQRIYQEAKSQGYRASLLTQERPNIFKQSVANIEPDKKIDISITFFNPLKYENGEYEFAFPTVVGPRFNPPGSSTGIGAVGTGAHANSGQQTDVHYLKPDESSAHDISINVDIDAGVSIEKVYSNSHVIKVNKNNTTHAIVTLSPNDRVPNKDFVLRYKTSGSEVKTAMMVHKGDKGNYFSLLLQPPEDLKNLPRIPREMVFVLDCSGSMDGKPISKAKEAVTRALKNLDKNDTFQIIQFSSNASSLGPNPIKATPENVKKGLQYLDSLYSEGGTVMIEGIKAALDFPHDKNRLRIVSFMTDGYIGNEDEILAAIHERLGESRIFSFGVGSSVNRYLLEHMATMGRGAVAYVGLNESAGEAVDRFYEVATRPAMANIKIDWGNIEVEDLYPKSIPDLFVGRPIMITGRLKNALTGRIRINGQVGKNESYFDVTIDPNNSEAKHPGIQSVWARNKIAELSNRETYNPSDRLKKEIIAASVNYNLISQYTAFLAVDSLERTEGDHGYTVDVPVPVPDGVKYGTTVAN